MRVCDLLKVIDSEEVVSVVTYDNISIKCDLAVIYNPFEIGKTIWEASVIKMYVSDGLVIVINYSYAELLKGGELDV